MGYRILKQGMSVAFLGIAGFHIDHPDAQAMSKKETTLRNVEYLTQKFPEPKSFPIIVEERRFEKQTSAWERVVQDRLQGRFHHLEFRRFLKHPTLYARMLFRKRGPREGSVTVVIPAKNSAAYLEESVLSSIYQTRPPKEVYIVVDPSRDRTETLAMELSRRFGEVRCIVNSKERGVAESRNQGIVAAASDYVMFLDSDDVLNPRFFEKVAALLDQHPELGMAYSEYLEFGDRNRLVKLPPFNLKLLLVDCFFGWPVARRRALEDSGGFDSEQIFEDWELFIRVVGKGWGARGVNEPLYSYRIHKASISNLLNLKRKEGEDMIYEKHRALYDKYGIGRTDDGRWINPPSRSRT